MLAEHGQRREIEFLRRRQLPDFFQVLLIWFRVSQQANLEKEAIQPVVFRPTPDQGREYGALLIGQGGMF
jgi:hypothetical protein